MNLNEKLKGFKALLLELESGIELIPTKCSSVPLATTKIRDTCPDWVYAVCHRENSTFYFCQYPEFNTCILKHKMGCDDHALGYELARQELIEWVKGRISKIKNRAVGNPKNVRTIRKWKHWTGPSNPSIFEVD